jgi:hypothetical protein
MKRPIRNRYKGTKFQAVPKHLGTYPYFPPKEIEAIKTKVPVDPLVIDLRKLCHEINKAAPSINAKYITTGIIMLNKITIKVGDGIAEFKTTRIRYRDLHDLLYLLTFEKIINLKKEQISFITSTYGWYPRKKSGKQQYLHENRRYNF